MHRIAVLLIAIIMVGCGSESSSPNINLSESTPTPEMTSNEKEYMEDAIRVRDTYNDATEELNELVNNPDVEDVQWRNDVIDAVSGWERAFTSFATLSPPPGLERFHERTLDGYATMADAAAAFKTGYVRLDNDALYRGDQMMREGFRVLESASSLVPEHIP